MRSDQKKERAAAREYVLASLNTEVRRRRNIVAMHPRGAYGDAYRREIARLWDIALRAVRAA